MLVLLAMPSSNFNTIKTREEGEGEGEGEEQNEESIASKQYPRMKGRTFILIHLLLLKP